VVQIGLPSLLIYPTTFAGPTLIILLFSEKFENSETIFLEYQRIVKENIKSPRIFYLSK